MFEPPLNVSFRSKVVDGKFFTLDGDKMENPMPYYARYIKSYEDLTDLEINYILLRYSNYNKALGELGGFVEKMKI